MIRFIYQKTQILLIHMAGEVKQTIIDIKKDSKKVMAASYPKKAPNMLVEKIKAFLSLVRIEHGLMVAVGVWVGALLAVKNADFQLLILGALPGVLVQMGAFAVNDLFDLEADRANNRNERPLVNGILSPMFARNSAIVLFILAVLLSLLLKLPAVCSIIVIASIIISIAYSYAMKNIAVLGNAYIAFSMALPFVFGALVFNALHNDVIIIAAVAFIAGLAREIMKTVQDMGGDVKARKAATLPVLIGKTKSKIIASILYIFAIILSYVMFFSFNYSVFYVVVVTLGNIGLVASIVFSFDKKDEAKSMEKARKLSLGGVFLALISFLIEAISKNMKP